MAHRKSQSLIRFALPVALLGAAFAAQADDISDITEIEPSDNSDESVLALDGNLKPASVDQMSFKNCITLKSPNSVLIGLTLDRNVDSLHKGGKNVGDRLGDNKRGDVVARSGNCVVSAGFYLDSSQRGFIPGEVPNGQQLQLDTGGVYASVGWEHYKQATPDNGWAAHIGLEVVNGEVLEALQGFVEAVHDLSGSGTRISGPTTDKLVFTPRGLVRFDRGQTLWQSDNIHLKAHMAGGAFASFYEQRGSLAAGLKLGFGKSTNERGYHLPLTRHPAPDNQGTFIAAGFEAMAVANDIRTDPLGTKTLQAIFRAQAGIKISKSVSFSLSYEDPLTPTLNDPAVFNQKYTSELERMRAELTVSF